MSHGLPLGQDGAPGWPAPRCCPACTGPPSFSLTPRAWAPTGRLPRPSPYQALSAGCLLSLPCPENQGTNVCAAARPRLMRPSSPGLGQVPPPSPQHPDSSFRGSVWSSCGIGEHLHEPCFEPLTWQTAHFHLLQSFLRGFLSFFHLEHLPLSPRFAKLSGCSSATDASLTCALEEGHRTGPPWPPAPGAPGARLVWAVAGHDRHRRTGVQGCLLVTVCDVWLQPLWACG